MSGTKTKTSQGVKPQYLVRITAPTKEVPAEYYSDSVAWKGVPRDQATKMTHKEANRISVYLFRTIGCAHCVMEPA